MLIIEPGRHGFPGPKGQRGEHGANGPNVSKIKILISICIIFFYHVDLRPSTTSNISWTSWLSSMCRILIISNRNFCF